MPGPSAEAFFAALERTDRDDAPLPTRAGFGSTPSSTRTNGWLPGGARSGAYDLNVDA
ncbi:MAG: hypothetical protein AVDCRST_MAG19-3222 [uncultured Thermomicrobiales bacterium]|uniref:Uncharacterized protein n=1 Tax=uncultured Thermomicrobiales bacterium TaxID=1645740 RepID=A0A6J4VEF0_9BACT|nr:MAG: hypothetical protein AVDCRST_MAG19-3222 [uncultured Thermomicrobiales bacterium]